MVVSADGAGEETMAGGAGDETMAGSDLEGAEQEAAAVPEDAVFAQRDRLESLLAAEEPDIEAVCGILDALMGKWNDIQAKQVVLGPPFRRRRCPFLDKVLGTVSKLSS